MKTLHFASILVLASTVTFVACGDDDDDATPGTAGSSGAAGENSSAGSDNTAGKNGTAGSGAAGKSTGGSSGDAGAGGGAGETQGGAGAGGQGGVGGEGGAPFVCPADEFGGAGGAFGSGGAGGEGGGNGAALEIIGKWSSPFSTEIIREDRWRSFGTGFDGTSAIVEYDNDANVVYTESNCTFSKNVYLDISGDSFYYCTVAYGLPSLAAAKADTKVANPATPETNGCGGFAWSKLTRL
ncbi:MAG TPA: hypothetical protein VHP33_22230 [Polyangiaceae bacterium]|nr:hypothetical protein [Polyangiaceae bacterium]